MLNAYYLIVAHDSASNLQTRFLGWQKALESKGLKSNAGKTETMAYSKTDQPLVFKNSIGKKFKQIGEMPKYLNLGSVANAINGWCQEDD